MISLGIMTLRVGAGFPKLQEKLEPAIENVLNQIALQLEARAKELAPYETGALEGSIKSERVDKLQYRVFTNVEYGLYQELGFSHWKSSDWIQNPFFLPAAQEVKQELASIAQAKLRESISV